MMIAKPEKSIVLTVINLLVGLFCAAFWMGIIGGIAWLIAPGADLSWVWWVGVVAMAGAVLMLRFAQWLNR